MDALKESENRFRTVIESASLAMFVALKMEFTYLNPAALRLLGATTPEQLIGQPVLSRIHPSYHESIGKRDEQKGMAPQWVGPATSMRRALKRASSSRRVPGRRVMRVPSRQQQGCRSGSGCCS